jgi:hypothetical protein
MAPPVRTRQTMSRALAAMSWRRRVERIRRGTLPKVAGGRPMGVMMPRSCQTSSPPSSPSSPNTGAAATWRAGSRAGWSGSGARARPGSRPPPRPCLLVMPAIAPELRSRSTGGLRSVAPAAIPPAARHPQPCPPSVTSTSGRISDLPTADGPGSAPKPRPLDGHARSLSKDSRLAG